MGRDSGSYDIQEFLQDYAAESPDKEVRIINAAINAFSEKGFEATRTREIAERAGVAEGTIFRYFPTKNAILERMVPLLIRVMMPRIKDPIDSILAGNRGAPVDRIFTEILCDRIHMIRDNGRFIRSVLPELIHRAPLLNQLKESLLPMIERYVAQVVDYGKSRGELRAELDAHFVMLQMFGFVLSYGMFGGKAEQSDERSDVERFVQNAMGGWRSRVVVSGI